MKMMFSCFMVFLSILLFLGTNGQKFGSAADLQCNCAETADCDPDNGFCPNGCQPGWFGPGCQIGNIAFKKAAVQSSTHTNEDQYVHGASRAVDGQLPSVSERALWCSDTQLTEKTWWYVQLGSEPYVVQNVTLYNRLDEYKTRLRKFSIILSNDTDTPNLSSWLVCAYQEAFLDVVGTYNCSQRLAKRVGVYLDFQENMAICEAVVIGYKYVACTNPSATGPGCLLTTCTSKACTDASGVCDSYKVCQFPSCPGDVHWPPECWINMPSLSNSTVTAVPTCDTIAVNLTRIQSGNLAISSITLEVHSAEGAMQQTAISFGGSYIAPLSAKVKAMAGKSYALIFRPTACAGGQCKNGPASKAVTVLTKARSLTYTVNGSCAYFSLNGPDDGCEAVKRVTVSCLDVDRAVNITGNGTTVCGVDIGFRYRCNAAVVNSQDLKEEYAMTFTTASVDGAGGGTTIDYVPVDGNLGAIVGGAVGGTVALACLFVVLVVLMRRRLHDHEQPESRTMASESAAYMSDIRVGEECTYENLSDTTLVQYEPYIAEEPTVPEGFKGMTSETYHGHVAAKPGCEKQNKSDEPCNNPQE